MNTAVEFGGHSDMIRPPVNHLMKALDRSFFRKNIRVCAAQVFNVKDISKTRVALKSDLLHLGRLKSIVSVPGDESEMKAFLLRPEIKNEDQLTWSDKLRELNHAQKIKMIDYELKLDYDDWNYHEIMTAVLPVDAVGDEVPSGFSLIGHVAHLNLREEYLPYKTLIADVLMDKNSAVRSVINKIEDVGEQSEFRTFKYELLAGDPDMNVEVNAENCVFNFDFSKVYWNPRLNTEHHRMISMFKPGEAVCDVMAGIGPFAVPSGKKHVFVWANDLNPDSLLSLRQAIKRNKVADFVKPFCNDGRIFIRQATKSLSEIEYATTVFCKASQTPNLTSNQGFVPGPPSDPRHRKVYVQPHTFSHYIMNLPAAASSFLPSFIGLFVGLEHLFTHSYQDPLLEQEMPMIHLYCFSTKSDDNAAEKIKICDEISRRLGAKVLPEDKDVEIRPVRDVAPNKRMFCASFRLPAEVAFRPE